MSAFEKEIESLINSSDFPKVISLLEEEINQNNEISTKYKYSLKLAEVYYLNRNFKKSKNLAENLLDTLRDSRVGSSTVSPISNVRDVLRYLRDAKTLMEYNPR